MNEEEEKYARELLLKGCGGNTDLIKNIKFVYNEKLWLAAAGFQTIHIGQAFHLLNEKQKVACLEHEFLGHIRNLDSLKGLARVGIIALSRYAISTVAGSCVYKISRKNNLTKIPSMFLSLVTFVTTKNMLYPIHAYEPWLSIFQDRHAEYRADKAIVDNCPDLSYIKEWIKGAKSLPNPPNPDNLQDLDRPKPIKVLTEICKMFPKNSFAQTLRQIALDPAHPKDENRIKRLESALGKMEAKSLEKKE